jgi:hypothetical protein
MKELTLAIATCGRPKVLRRCITSIKKFVDFPNKIILLDNTKAFTDEINNNWASKISDKYIEVADRKIGCCESNQMMVDECDTDYIMHLDDDIYFDKSGIVTSMMEHLKKKKSDIVSCLWYDHYYKRFREAAVKHMIGYVNGKKSFFKISIPPELCNGIGFNVVESDEALHSMIIPMNIYKDIHWDIHYAWKGDREDFFLQVKDKGYKIQTMLNHFVHHDPQPFKYGSLSYEYDGKPALEYFERKWGMKPLFGWDKFQDKPR